MPGYAVVQFIGWGGGKSVLAVPEKWIMTIDEQLKCYFPKTNASKAIQEQHDVHANWKCFNVRQLSHKPILTYDLASIKENDARFTSAVDSDTDNNEHHQSIVNAVKAVGKRNKRRPARLDSCNIDNDENIEDCGVSKPKRQAFNLPVAPRFKSGKLPLTNIINAANATVKQSHTASIAPPTVKSPCPQHVQATANPHHEMGFRTMVMNSMQLSQPPLTQTSNSIAPPDESPRPQHVQATASPHHEMGFRTMVMNSMQLSQPPLTQTSNSIAPTDESPPPQHVQATASPHHEMGFRAMPVNSVQLNQPPSTQTPKSIAPPDESPRPQHVQASASPHHEMGFPAMPVNSMQLNQLPLTQTPNSIAPPPVESLRPQHIQASASPQQMGFCAVPVNNMQPTPYEPAHSSYTSLQSKPHCSQQVQADVKFLDQFNCQHMDNMQRDRYQVHLSSEISQLSQSVDIVDPHDGMSFGAMLMDNMPFDHSGLLSVSGSSFVERDATSASQQRQVCLQSTPTGKVQTAHFNFDLSSDISTHPVQITNAPPSSLSGKLEFLINIVSEIRINQQELQRSVQCLLDSKSSSSAVELELDDFGLPVDSDEAMFELDKMLDDKSKRTLLKRVLLRSTGRTLSSAVTRLMKSCITHQLASKYTLFGKSKMKKNFSSHRLYKVLIQVVLRAFPTTNQDEINVHVGSYMRHAPSKPGCPKHKKSAVPTTRHEHIFDDSDDDDQ